MNRICVIGAGYVGLTTAACFAHLGNNVICSDVNEDRVRSINSGELPIVEEGLEDLVARYLASGDLVVTTDNIVAVSQADFVFLCLPTPEGPNGRADMTRVNEVASSIGPHLKVGAVVVNKSTVPIGSANVVRQALQRQDVQVVSNPEFLREGTAIHDFLNPDRVVIGADDEEAAIRLSSLYVKLGAPIVVTDAATAETIKYASNAFLATKLSFVNALATLCESVGADVRQVTLGMGYDPRVGSSFLKPGPGWGGSCFPKDVAALIGMAEDAGYDFALLKGVVAINDLQHRRIVEKVVRLVGGDINGKKVALWGLTFKANTDDLRESPALKIAELLAELGAQVAGYDPTVHNGLEGLTVVDDPYSACQDAVAVVVTTEWDEFRWIDFDKVGSVMQRRVVVDARNLLDASTVRKNGFTYEGIGIR